MNRNYSIAGSSMTEAKPDAARPCLNPKPESEGANPTTSGKKFEWDNYLIGSFLMQKLDLDVQENRFPDCESSNCTHVNSYSAN
jgi:hypothetical protein